MKLKQVDVGIFDEAQSYDLDQILAVTAMPGPQDACFKTIVLAGDPHQIVANTWPRWTRVPWISSEGRSMRPAQEQDTDTPSVTGRPAPQTIKNPENRPFMTWLTSPARKDDVLLLELNGCKRCGPEVCKFVAALFPQFCPKLYASPEAPETRLTHTFYDCPWTQVTPPSAEPSSALFNEVLFATLADQILKQTSLMPQTLANNIRCHLFLYLSICIVMQLR